jgi:hypothetical protein
MEKYKLFFASGDDITVTCNLWDLTNKEPSFRELKTDKVEENGKLYINLHQVIYFHKIDEESDHDIATNIGQ